MDAGLLARADADGLSVLHIADGIGLGILQGDQGDLHVDERRLRNVLFIRYHVGKQLFIHAQLVSPLLEGDAVHLLSLDFSRTVIRIDLDHIVVPLFLLFQNFQRLRRVAGSDHTIGNLSLDEFCRVHIADVGQGNKISEGGHPVRAARPRIGAGQGRKLSQIIHPIDLCQRLRQRKPHRSACRGNVLEGGRRRKSRGFLQFLHQLPAV